MLDSDAVSFVMKKELVSITNHASRCRADAGSVVRDPQHSERITENGTSSHSRVCCISDLVVFGG